MTVTGVIDGNPALKGRIGIGNVRYATSGFSDTLSLQRDAMPVVETNEKKGVAISFNGNIVNIRALQRMKGVDCIYSDAHVISRLIIDCLSETDSIEEAAKVCMQKIDGSFAITGLSSDGELFAFKDGVGVKPLCYGKNECAIAFSSESVGLDINDIKIEREIKPGEFIKVKNGFTTCEQLVPCKNKAFCAFEFAYFARPDSIFEGTYVYQARQNFGRNLANSYSDTASRCEVVVSIPETANDAAYGFHVETGLPWDMATRRHRYVNQRAFITGVDQREGIIGRKVNLLERQIKGKRIAVVDDSIVRGDTTRNFVKRFRSSGALEVHLFITFPRITGPCFYGIDMATFGELIGAYNDSEGVAEEIGADSVNYQAIDDYMKATGMKNDELCFGCVNGDYPTMMANEMAKKMKELLFKGGKEKGRIYENT
jgi:amidophosphoribosyltransferase